MSLALKKISYQQCIRVMVVEDDKNLREALTETLELVDYSVVSVDSAEQALEILAKDNDIRLIVSDVNMSGMSGHDLLRCVKQLHPHIPLLLITAYASISESVDAMKQGAVDYLVKPFAPKTLVETIEKHLGVAQTLGDAPVAVAASSQQLLQLAQRVAASESTVLIVGESGTGKEVLARYVHDHSPRKNNPFVAINCAAIPENMLEAMLFGYEKGAYTGAHTSSPGKFEQAEGGTLLLDEISEMDIGLQAKLLRVLQEREVERLGGRKTIKLDVRVIATSNRELHNEVIAGRFREDLYYRLSVLPLQWLPLRERVDDIIPLAEKLLQKHAKKQNRHGVNLSIAAQAALKQYSWPGNVRELDNIMQRALILQQGTSIGEFDLGLINNGHYAQPIVKNEVSHDQLQQLSTGNPSTAVISVSDSSMHAFTVSDFNLDTISLVSEKKVNNYALNNPALGNDLKQREYEIIMNTLRNERGSRKNTAERLGISARTLRYKIARLREEGYAITE